MKTAAINIAVAASFAAGVVADAHHHHHQHLHKKRDPAVEYVPEYKTVYVMAGEEVSSADAQAGIDKGLYTVLGETTPTFSPPPPPPEPTTTSSSQGGMFIEQVTTSSSSTTTPPPKPTTSSSAAAEPTSSAPATGGGLDAEFPDGELSCSDPPYDYGVIPIEWLGMNGWSGIQKTPDYSFGIDSMISFIETAISGETCQEKSFCTYGCPDGYVPSQWPEAQGNTGQSIGGLYCNENGKLELSRPSVPQLCIPGVGGVKVVNKMSKNVAICRTAYPGTESMVNPLDSQPGTTVDMANIDVTSYYEWQGQETTLQYYVNQPGVSIEDGCVWDCAENHDECGNWAPAIIGTGKSSDGITYLSVFPNVPTSSANPSFNIEISGDVSMECSYKKGVGYSQTNGCTTGINPGGVATITFSD